MNRKEKVSISKQEPTKRIQNFDEVCLGYNTKEAQLEAGRCLQCADKPCIKGCPVRIDIPQFIKYIQEGKFSKAVEEVKKKNTLPGICGRVCPQEEQCEEVCTAGKMGEPIAIGKLERFVSDWELKQTNGTINRRRKKIFDSKKIAVVGSGPAGLTCAGELAKSGYRVTIYEALHEPGGVLRYGIPGIRLPNHIVRKEIKYVKSLGVEIKTDVVGGVTLSIDDIFEEGFKAIFLGIGAGLPYFMNIPGENLNGIYSANEFLTRANLMKAYSPEYDTPLKVRSPVGVIGGGNTAIDSSRVAKRINGAEVEVFYRRSEKEMPARKEEIENAKEEGIKFNFLSTPIRYIEGSEKGVELMECIKMKLGELDDSGRRKPLPIEGSNFTKKIRTVIVAIGQGPNPILSRNTPDLKVDERGYIKVDENSMSSIPGVFAGGDIVTGEGTVIAAMGEAKKIAENIDEYVNK